jgi:membrane-associated phospholipid phosphatase
VLGNRLVRRLVLGLGLLAVAFVIDRLACPVLRTVTLYDHLGEVREGLVAAKFLGSGLGAVVVGSVVWALDRRRWRRAGVLWLVVALAGLGTNALKVASGRERPSHDDQPVGEERHAFHGPQKGLREAAFQSFPSGHTTGAFAVATCLAAFYPQARWVVYGVAAAAGVNRVVEHEHFLSDVIAGALTGHLVASWLLSLAPLRRRWQQGRVDSGRPPP